MKFKKSKIKKYSLILIPLIIILVLISLSFNEPVIKVGDNVTLDYTGYLSDGSVFDSSINSIPLTFVTGTNSMIPGFEKAVINMKKGESKTFTLSPIEAYGNLRPELVMDYNKTIITESLGAEPITGMTIYTSTGYPAVIINVTDVNVTIDFNHPLAGKSLTFSIKILDVVKNA